MKRFMPKHKTFFRLVPALAAFLLLPLCLSAVVQSTMSESLKDDVTAMITNAKKLPHTIFVIDTSENMNSFAYSDYIDTCRDGQENIAKARILCENAYQQCRNVEKNASCDVDLGCGDVSSKCAQMRQVEASLKDFCTKISNTYPEPGRKDTVTSYSDPRALKYVGPWDPTESSYTQDLCFYDWTQDSDGDVLNDTNSGHPTNLIGTDRRDWDCITDGKGKMSNGEKFTGVSGLWLNWKYATSLDALKIILADVHEFSYPPTSRGTNHCLGYQYKPVNEYLEQVEGSGGTIGNVAKKICYVSFDTTFKDMDPDKRADQLAAMMDIIPTAWTEVDLLESAPSGDLDCKTENGKQVCFFRDEFCAVPADEFLMKDFSLYDGYSSDVLHSYDLGTSHPSPVSASNCGKCMAWNTMTKSFEETECTVFKEETTKPSVSDETLGKQISTTLSKQCCKTYECTNPKCRDNDLTCQSEGGSCILGYYSEYDQDINHCCDDISCAEEGTSEFTCPAGVDDCVAHPEKMCQYCKNGSVLGSDTANNISTGVKEVTVDPSGSTMQGYNSSDPSNMNISIAVKIKDFSITDFEQLSEVKISVYSGCRNMENGSLQHPSDLLGTYTCSDAESCADGTVVASGMLSGCSDKGYVLEGVASITRKNCRFSDFNVSFKLVYDRGAYKIGSSDDAEVLPDTAIYQIFQMQSSSDPSNIVKEYECKTSFYHRQSAVSNSTSCPSASSAPAMINAQTPGANVEYCESRTAEREVIARDNWGVATKVVCSWLCRDAVVYDDPWKCSAYFWMTDDKKMNGMQHCPSCYTSTGVNGETDYNIRGSDGFTDTEKCCKCIDTEWGAYYHHEAVQGVTINGSKYRCAVSTYEFGTASNGTTTETSGYMAELVEGHIKEAGSGSYLLTPYFEDGALFSPYNGWYHNHSLIVKGEGFIKDTFVSAFQTTNRAKRVPACMYDLMWAWEGEDCNSCGTGCCAVDLSQDDTGCEYPNFWMKVPQSDGGEYIFGAGDISNEETYVQFRNTVKGLKAKGGSTLGETLYDVWRYLGGMYSLHDPNHTPNTGKPYTSLFENQDATCFTNEAIVISGGQPQFDHNDALADKERNTANGYDNQSVSVTCSEMNFNSSATNQPCVKHIAGDAPNNYKPYYERDWYQSSLINVANFAKNNSFWGKDSCRTSKDLRKNALGFTGDCVDEYTSTGADMAVINHVHTIAIGEWALAPLYHHINKDTDYLDSSLLKQVAEKTEGKYYGLTADPGSAGSNGNFLNLTDLFTDMMNTTQESDIVSGRPHWTSSLVQPFDVEEKYRGPEAYAAGAVPIDGSVSRFWFGNLKRYSIDDEKSGCNITDDEAGSCGEWKKQKFQSAADCFAPTDNGSDMVESGDDFKTLMAGGAAKILADKLKTTSCGALPCFSGNTARNIYYDLGNGTKMKALKDLTASDFTDDSAFVAKFKQYSAEVTGEKVQKIIDYMYGFDAFAGNASGGDPDASRKKIRYTDTNNKLVEVADPVNVDFKGKYVKIRPLLLGAIIHSKPVAVYYESDSDTRIYAGANDGMLHAFDGNGNEVYAYMPSNAFKSILSFGNEQKGIFFNATVDGPIAMLHIDQSHDGMINNGEKAYLIFGYRRGASGYTVIDISDPDKPEFVQNINTDGGYSFGKAVVFRKCTGQCSYAEDLEYYLAVPGGYDMCNDPARTSTIVNENKPSCEQSELKGNKFTIYKFDYNKSTKEGKFKEEEKIVFGKGSSSSRMSDEDKSWLVSSFASVPFAVNTSGKAAVNTEFVYFTDLTGTVFRVDVRDNNSGNWNAKVVFSQRDYESGTKTTNWRHGRSFVATNFFPPLERYNPGKDDCLLPIPMITGNSANPRYTAETDGFFVFYDHKKEDEKCKAYARVYSDDYKINSSGEITNGNKFWQETGADRGWKIAFGGGDKAGEKGITEPLITFDVYGSKVSEEKGKNGYTIAWNTYIPKKATDCRNFGTSHNYERLLIDGTQAFEDKSATGLNGEWDPSKCSVSEPDISIATGVGIVATEQGYDLTFGAGADIYRKREIVVKSNTTHIIKWYELY